MIQAS